MSAETLIGLGVLWLVFGLIRRAGTQRPPTGPNPRPTPGPRPLPQPRARPPLVDASQLEGLQLETLLKGLQGRLERSATPEREVEVVEAEPPVVDSDDEAERITARRIAEAEARSRPLTDADHQRFDQQIRQQPADHTAVARFTQRQLRDAVVWNEILARPKGDW